MSYSQADGPQAGTQTPEELEDAWLQNWLDAEIILGHGKVPATREELLSLVEPPLRSACGDFYDKNVRTYTSSCNALDLMNRGGRATIGIDWETLSEENRAIAAEIPEAQVLAVDDSDTETGPKILILYFPIRQFETPAEIGERATEVARQFVWQPMTWALQWTLDEARQRIQVEDRDLTHLSDEELMHVLREKGLFVDNDMHVWLSEEHYTKTQQKGDVWQPRM